MKKIKNILIAAVCVLALGSCEKFLNVNPKGEVFDQDMFTTAEGFEDALYFSRMFKKYTGVSPQKYKG